jgi:hypothetical protein
MLQASLAFHDFFSNCKQQKPEDSIESSVSKPCLVCSGIDEKESVALQQFVYSCRMMGFSL